MAPRIRTIKPEIWDSRDFMSLTVIGKLTFLALISLADDEGRLEGDAEWLQARCIRGVRVSLVRTSLGLCVLKGMVTLYSHRGKPYIQLTNWSKHQRVDHPKPSSIPPPPSRTFANDREEEGIPREASIPRARPRIGSDLIGSDLTPPTPPPAPGDKATVILAGFLEASNKSTYSPIDAVKAQEYATDFQRASGGQIADWLREHATWMAAQKKRPYGKLEYYAEFLRQQHDRAADNGARIVSSSEGPRIDGLTRVSESLS